MVLAADLLALKIKRSIVYIVFVSFNYKNDPDTYKSMSFNHKNPIVDVRADRNIFGELIHFLLFIFGHRVEIDYYWNILSYQTFLTLIYGCAVIIQLQIYIGMMQNCSSFLVY